jgi:hypothetical protein
LSKLGEGIKKMEDKEQELEELKKRDEENFGTNQMIGRRETGSEGEKEAGKRGISKKRLKD